MPLPLLCYPLQRRRQQEQRQKNKCLQNNSSARTHVHHAFYISLTSLHDYHVKLPHATYLHDEEFTFSFWTWQYGPFKFYSGKNHPRLTNWAGLNAIKFKKRELFFLPTFSLPLSSRLLKLAIFRGGKSTNPLLKLFSFLTYFLTCKLIIDRLYCYTSPCPHIKVWYSIRVSTELPKDTSYSTIYHLCMYLKLNLFVELFYIYRWEYLNKVVADWIYEPQFWHVHRISLILFVQTRLIIFCFVF